LNKFLGNELSLSGIEAVIRRKNGMCPHFYLHSFNYLEMVTSWNCLRKFNTIEKKKTRELLCDSDRGRGGKEERDDD
jgi:hypothetical protein